MKKVNPIFTRKFKEDAERVAELTKVSVDTILNEVGQIINNLSMDAIEDMHHGVVVGTGLWDCGYFCIGGFLLHPGGISLQAKDLENWEEYYTYRVAEEAYWQSRANNEDDEDDDD